MPEQEARSAATVRPETRFIVVPRGSGLYGVRDRRNGSLIMDDLTRKEARMIVWEKNGRHGSLPSRWRRG